jgi:tetratricopeptide (TPR) repeat protein
MILRQGGADHEVRNYLPVSGRDCGLVKRHSVCASHRKRLGGHVLRGQCDRALSEEGLVSSDVVATHVNRGVLRLRLGNIEEAISDFDRAIALNPDMPEAYLNKGSALIRAGQADAAVPLFSKALATRTRKPAYAYYGRGVAYEELGNIKSAYLDYRRASAADPEWAAPRQDLARFRVK